jgi:thioredoxin-related protein
MKKILFTLLALPLVLGSFVSSEEKGFEIGDTAPLAQYDMKNCNDGSNSLRQSVLQNGLVVVFSCNTCPFVVGNEHFKGWESQYNDLHAYATENKLGFILVNSNEGKRDDDDSMDEMRNHADRKGYKMPYLLDENSKLANAFGAKTTPHVFVLNSKLELVYKGSIDNGSDTRREKDIPYLKTAINELVSGRAISTAETAPRGCSIKRI